MPLTPLRCLALALFPIAASAQSTVLPDPERAEARAIFKELIEINTTTGTGGGTRAAEAIAARMRAAGFPAADIHIVGPNEKDRNIVVRLRGSGTGGKPILLLAHLDVVAAKREDWPTDPFTFVEKEGYFYARGTQDNKAGASMLVANLIRLRKEGYVPDRDLIMVLTSDEETDARGGAIWLLANQRPLIDAEYALNTDAGGGMLKKGKPVMFSLSASEKVYQSYKIEVRNVGGHSSVPRADNAIYALARGLDRLGRFQFPVQMSEITRAMFREGATLEQGQRAFDMRDVAARGGAATAAVARLASVPSLSSSMRTTCVATMLEGGHAENALPQLARATVNCRVLPGVPLDSVTRVLKRIMSDTAIHVTPIDEGVASPPSPLTIGAVATIQQLSKTFFPAARFIPVMSLGATDGLFFRNAGIPTYASSAMFSEEGEDRAHGQNERVGVDTFYTATQFWYELMKVVGKSRSAQP